MPFLRMAPAPIPRRLILCFSGGEKSGKTDFPLRTAPEPVYHACLDPNGEAVAQKIRNQTGRDIRIAKYGRRGMVATEARAHWEQFCTDVADITKEHHDSGESGTLVWDSGTEVWELARLAYFGKLEGVGKSRNYGPVNAAMRKLYADVYDSPLNLVVTQKLGPEYINDVATGRFIPKGWGDTAYTVQANAQAIFVPDAPWPFLIQIENCALRYDLAGQVLPTNVFSFDDWLDLVSEE